MATFQLFFHLGWAKDLSPPLYMYLSKLMIQIIVMQLVHFSSYDNANNLIALLSGYSSADQNIVYVDWDKTVHLTPVRSKGQGDQRCLMGGR